MAPWLLVWLIGCSKQPVPSAAATDDMDAAITALRFRVASAPKDGPAHAALARLEVRAARPGAALRHFERARQGRALSADDRVTLASLYARRFAERLRAEDGGAYRDALAAMDLGHDIERAALAEARFLAALAALRHGTSWGRAEASTQLEEARALAPGDPRLAALDAGSAALESVADAALWLFHGGARREAMAALDTYVARGGRDPDALRAFLVLRRWWGDIDGSRRIDLMLRREIMAAGVSLCSIAERADELGCAGTLWSVATGPAWVAADVRARAEALDWRAAHPAEAAAWALLTLRGYLAGEGDWDALLARRVDAGAILDNPGAVPGDAAASAASVHAVAPALLHLAGRGHEAQEALDRALAHAQQDTLDAGTRALLLAGAALHDRDPDVIDGLLATPEAWSSSASLRGDGWRLAVRHARARGDVDRVAALREAAPAAVAHERTLRMDDARGAPEHAALLRVARAYVDEPAVADRLAGDFVDGVAYMGRRAPLVAALFLALGDTTRARVWWERVISLHQGSPAHERELGLLLAREGDEIRARVHLLSATARSGDTGAASLEVARELLALGQPLEAIATARRALSLTAPAHRDPVLRLITAAMIALGRGDEAAALRAQIRVDASDRAATARQAARAPGAPAPWPSHADSVLAWLERGADPAIAHQRLAATLAWNPGHARLHAAQLRALAPQRPAHTRAIADLVALLTLAADGADGAALARSVATILHDALAPLDRGARRHAFAPGS